MRADNVRHNPFFEALWPHVTVSSAPRVVEVVIGTAAALGFADGCTLTELLKSTVPLNLRPCSLEVAVKLRLALGEPPGTPRITVASLPHTSDERLPRGLYLRTDAEGSWLRAYRASDDWRYGAEERFALLVADYFAAPACED